MAINEHDDRTALLADIARIEASMRGLINGSDLLKSARFSRARALLLDGLGDVVAAKDAIELTPPIARLE